MMFLFIFRRGFVALLLLFLWVHEISAQPLDSLIRALNNTPPNEKSTYYNKLTLSYLTISLDTAHLYCDSALVMAEKENQLEQKALALKNRGVLYYFQGFYLEAMSFYNQSLLLNRQIGDSASVAALNNNMAIVYELMGDFEQAIQNHLAALRYYELYGKPSEIARSYTNIGTVYGAIENYHKSLEYQKKAFKIYQLNNDSTGMANIFNNMASDYSELNYYDSSLFYHKKSLEIREKINDTRGIATSLINMGNQLQNSKNYNEALQTYERALKIVRKLDDKRAETSVYLSKATVLMQLNEFEKAQESLAEAENLAKTYNYPAFIRDISYSYAILYKSKGDLSQAYTYLHRYITYKDSLLKLDNANYIADLESKYQFEKKNQQIQFQEEQLVVQKREIQQNRLIALLGFALFLVALGFLALISWALRSKQRSHQQIEHQNKVLTTQKKQITDSIHYAERIQNAVLPNDQTLQQYFPKCFLLYLPKDIVSGDFVWVRKVDCKLVLAIADCTGHGVPGALMSMLGISFLNEISHRLTFPEPSQILDEMREFIKSSLNQTGALGETKEGLVINIFVFDENLSGCRYASAHHPAYLLREKQFLQLNYDKQPVGIYYKELPFITYDLQFQPGDQLVCFSDGYCDQFDTGANQRYTNRRFKEFLLSISDHEPSLQKQFLFDEFLKWKGTSDQIDDITIVGIQW